MARPDQSRFEMRRVKGLEAAVGESDGSLSKIPRQLRYGRKEATERLPPTSGSFRAPRGRIVTTETAQVLT
jgi:hypothetical protein